MSLSRRARKQITAFLVLVALIAVVGVGGNYLRNARKASSAKEGLRLGTAAFERADYPETLVQLSRYLPSNQSDADAFYMIAKARLEVPQDGGAHYPSALGWAGRAVDLDPDSLEKRLLVVEVLAASRSGTLPDLLSAIDGVLSLDPSRTDLRLLKADILSASERDADALEELRSIAGRDPDSIDALSRIAQLLIKQPARYNEWVTSLDQQAEQNPKSASLDIARLSARLRLISTTARDSGSAAISASRALSAYDLLTQSLLAKTVTDPVQFRAALAIVDEVERALRLTRPQNPQEAQATQDRLDAVDAAARAFIDRHIDPNESGALTDPQTNAPLVLAAFEWLWTSDRVERLNQIALAWRSAADQPPTAGPAVAIESLITITGALPADQLVQIAETPSSPAGQLWKHLAVASDALRDGRLTDAAETLQQAAEAASDIQSSLLFSSAPVRDRAVQSFLVYSAEPALSILQAQTASAAGDTARAVSLWTEAARARRAWDLPALQLLDTYRGRGSIAEADQMASEAMLRGATLGTGLSMIESRVEQYALGLLPYEAAADALTDLADAGFPGPPIAVARFRLAIAGSLREADRRDQLIEQVASTLTDTAAQAASDPASAEVLVRMLRAADELGVVADPRYIATQQREPILEAINAQFSSLSPESKYVASLAETHMTGVYGPALSRLTAETRRVLDAGEAGEQARFEHQRILARFTSELARTYQALDEQAYRLLLQFAEDHPGNAAAQTLFIDSLLRSGEISATRTAPLADALDRLRDILGPDSYTYNLAESRRLYADPSTRTPDVARQEIISRLDRFVEGTQAGGASVEVLHLVAKWWEQLPGSLDRRLRYLRRAQQTSPTAWGVYPDLTLALIEAGEWDDAAAALARWGRQLTPSLTLRSQRRDLAQTVGDRWIRIVSGSPDPNAVQTLFVLWSLALDDAFAVADATADPADRLRAAQILINAPDSGPIQQRAGAILGLDTAALERIALSRPATPSSGQAVADATIAAGVHQARALLQAIPQSDAPPADHILAIAGAGRLIAKNTATARLTAAVASGQITDFPAVREATPDPDAARQAIASALLATTDELSTRVLAMFYALSYEPETWRAESDAARSAMLAAASLTTLTAEERRALVYPLSQLGEIDTAIQLQRLVAASDTEGSDRLTGVVAIAEILREAGQTDAAYDAVQNLSEDQRNTLTSTSVAPRTQALVALLELETGQTQTPVTNAFARRVIDQPREMVDALEIAISSARGSAPRLALLKLITPDLALQPEFEPLVASLWFNAAIRADQDDRLRRELLNGTITRLNGIAARDNKNAQLFALRRRAYCEIELGSLDTGIRTYRQAVDIDPDDPSTLNNLADALLRRGQFPEAAEISQRAVDAADAAGMPLSERSVFYDTLGKARLALGTVPDALTALQTATELDSANTRARISLAEALAGAGESAESVRATLQHIGPAAEQNLSPDDRQRLARLREQFGLSSALP